MPPSSGLLDSCTLRFRTDSRGDSGLTGFDPPPPNNKYSPPLQNSTILLQVAWPTGPGAYWGPCYSLYPRPYWGLVCNKGIYSLCNPNACNIFPIPYYPTVRNNEPYTAWLDGGISSCGNPGTCSKRKIRQGSQIGFVR